MDLDSLAIFLSFYTDYFFIHQTNVLFRPFHLFSAFVLFCSLLLYFFTSK